MYIDPVVQTALDRLVARFNLIKLKFSSRKVAYHSVIAVLSKAVYDSLCIRLGVPLVPKVVRQEPIEIPSNFIPAEGERDPIPTPITYEEEFNFNDENLIDKFYADNKSVELSIYLACIRRIEAQVIYIIPYRSYGRYGYAFDGGDQCTVVNANAVVIAKGTYTVVTIPAGQPSLLHRVYNVWSDYIRHTSPEYGSGLVVDPNGVGYHSVHWPLAIAGSCFWSFTVPAGEDYSMHPAWDDPNTLGTNYTTVREVCHKEYRESVHRQTEKLAWSCYTTEVLADTTFCLSIVPAVSTRDLVEVPYLSLPDVEYEPEFDTEWYIRYTGQVRVKAVDSYYSPTLGFEDCYTAHKLYLNLKRYSGFNGKAGKNVLIKLDDSEETKLEKIASAQGTGYGSQGGFVMYEVNEMKSNEGVDPAEYLPLEALAYRDSGGNYHNGSDGVVLYISWSCNGIIL